MVYRCGFGKRMGPVSLMDTEEVYINAERSKGIADISTEMAKVAFQDIEEVRRRMRRVQDIEEMRRRMCCG
jgi:hypothetical protein